MKNYLIIGNSAGGIGASEAIRGLDKKGNITILSDEPYHTYSRPMISEYLSHERTYEQMFYRPADFYRKNSINFMPAKKVQKLDLDNKNAILDDNQKLVWDYLLLACGGQPIVPRTEGGDKKGIFSFTTLNDAKRLDNIVKSGSQAVVIGGGLIGMSLTQALIKRGVKVVVVEMKSHVLNTILDAQASMLVEEKLKTAGVKLVMGHTVARIMGKASEVEGVELDNGERIDCELLVFAIGVSPRLELVKGTDIGINRGILVDRSMRTSHPGVYSCGDMAEGYDFLLKINRLLPIWPAAYIGGRTAGFNMSGQNKEYDGATVMNALNYFSYSLVAAGLVNLEKEEGYEVLSSLKSSSSGSGQASLYRKIVLKDNRIVGLLYAGLVDRAGILFGLMKDGVDVSSFKGELLSPSFSFASMPEALRKERLNLTIKASSAGSGQAREKEGALQKA